MTTYNLTDWTTRDERGRLVGTVIGTVSGTHGAWTLTLPNGVVVPGTFKTHAAAADVAREAKS